MSPQQLQISSLITRINAGGIDEIILATNPSLEGESTVYT
ncbi:MAG TPA: hypothetical protein VMS08_04540 [Candidatus Saccharimonadia bacterium]|nr:hypothetical protein [Candidatus Saccharimonadia bacterium]